MQLVSVLKEKKKAAEFHIACFVLPQVYSKESQRRNIRCFGAQSSL